MAIYKWPQPTVTSPSGGNVSGIDVVFDGTVDLSYKNIGSGTQTLLLDYGESIPITEVKWWLYYDGRVFVNVALYGSNDNENWDTLRSPANWTSNSSGIDVVLESAPSYRYLKFSSSGSGYNSNEYCEIEVYSTEEPPAQPELRSLNKPCAVYSTLEGYPKGNANDGNTGTRYVSASATLPQWWSVDLEAEYAISKSVIIWETSNATDYDIQSSDDNENWTTVKNVTGSGARTDTVTWTQTTAHRYWRIDCNAIYGYMSPWEISLWGIEIETVNRRFAQII